METIHTDSAYKAFSRKSLSGSVIDMPLDQSAQKLKRKILEKPNVADQFSNLKAEVSSCSLFLRIFVQ